MFPRNDLHMLMASNETAGNVKQSLNSIVVISQRRSWPSVVFASCQWMLRRLVLLSTSFAGARVIHAASRHHKCCFFRSHRFSLSSIMTSQAPDAGTSVTTSVAKAVTNAGGETAGGSPAGEYQDELTGEMVSKR